MFKWLKSFFELKKNVPLNGMKAYDQGFKFTDNPFRKHIPDHSIWRDDYIFASQYPKVKKNANI